MSSRPQRCRSCNYRFAGKLKRCPVCAARQIRIVEPALLLCLLVLASLTAWLHWRPAVPPPETAEFSPPEASSSTLSTLQAANSPVRTAPAPTVTSVRPSSPPEPTERFYKDTRFHDDSQANRFYVAEKQWNDSKQIYEFYRRGMSGSERVLRSDARGAFLSENQADYPEPESGCGPTALLNLYIWYSKYGLVEESVRDADLDRYKQLKFREIDENMRALQKRSRTEAGGTNTIEQIVVLDELLQANSTRPLRLHFEIHKPPLTTRTFLELSRNYRAGLLSVRPKNPTTGRLEPNHAVLVIRSDTTGKITVANWGRFVHGRLRMRADGQWFIPDDPTQHELRINRLIVLIPFTPRN